jgi:NRPS condensation-like uncharacterized protein
MPPIKVDFDRFKKLSHRRPREEVTYNDFLAHAFKPMPVRQNDEELK